MFRNNFFRAYGFWHWGEGLQTVLFTWYMTFYAGLSATQIGAYQALVLAPFLVFTVLGGALTDRVGARLSYTVSTSLFAGILIAYGFVDQQLGFVPQAFFIYCCAVGIVSAISNPAIDTFIVGATEQSVQSNGLQAANAHNLAKLTGNLSGLLLPVVLATGGFVLNGMLMAASVVFLRRHHPSGDHARVPRGGSTTPTAAGAAVQAGMLQRLMRHYRLCPENFDILLSSCLLGLLVIPAGYILVPLTLRAQFPQQGDLIALVGIASWIGAIVATAAAKHLSARIIRPGAVSLVIWASYGLGLLLLMQVQSFTALCLLVCCFGTVKVGKALVYGKYLYNSPVADRGLIVSVDQTAFWGLATLGTAGMGWLVDGLGLDATIAITSGCVLAGVCALALRGRFAAMVQT
ncbi:MFS transporter [Phaeobacter sp.]|uniref:MFS transporter n=1 Tax=Phaeobacter sp. TaxID=1902409 RepID=UPI0025FA27C8|nr:MFS transporter [Phaeobacter sp.]